MKKTRKILSIVLAVLFAFSSMPVVYTGTAAADAVTYALDETGTKENPTLPIKASGTFVQSESDVYHLNIDQEYLDFVYYQTKDDEYFKFSQILHLEKYCGDWIASINVMVNNLRDGTDETTTSFFDKYQAEVTWFARDGYASGITGFPFEAYGTTWDCYDYNWELVTLFKGHSASEKGEINTGVTRHLDYTTTLSSGATDYTATIKTTAQIIDAREFINAVENAENIIANPDGYTKAYVSTVEATLNSIPETAKELSAVYTQSDLDGYTALLNDINKNSADYTEYNRLYKNLSSISNAKGAYTQESFLIFKSEIADIDSNLPKNLDSTYQDTVDEATQALRVAFSKLVATDVSKTDTPVTHSATGASADARITFNVDNTAFHLMQTKDAQVFQLNQRWTITRNSDTNLGETVPKLIGMTLDTTNPLVSHENCLSGGTSTLNPNNTSAFISRCISGVEGSQFSCWNQVSGEFNWLSNGKFSSGVEIEKGKTSVLEAKPVIQGLAKGETVSGGLSLNFLQKFEYEYTIGLIGGTDYTKHFHVNSTVKITDVRQLIAAHNEAGKVLANPEDYNYSEKYLTNLEAVYDSIPREMTAGVEYYDQATVDKLTYELKNVKEDGADYSEFVNLYNQMTAIENADRYTAESYETFKDEIEEININLDKTLDASQQSVVDEAVEALKAAYAKLDFYEVDGETVFSTYDIPGYETGELGNSPLYFELGRTEYNFMQTYDNQQFAIKTDLFLQKTNSSYNTEIYSLEYSSPVAGSSTCTEHSSTEHCHNLDNIKTNNSSDFLGIVANGVEIYAADADAQNWGAVGQNTTWVFDEERSSGSSFISNGKIAAQSNISMGTHYASSEIYCNGFGAGDNGDGRNPFTITYVWRLGWTYAQHTVLESTLWAQQVDRHVHIPVTVNLTDARALYKLYEEVTDIVKGDTEETYTLETIVNLYNVYKDIPTDMVYGEEYYTQEQVNAAYDALLAPRQALKEGADYSEYFAAYVKAQEIIATNNDDGYGNKIYEEDAFNTFVETVTNIDNGLDKNLDADETNQNTIKTATDGINGAISTLEENKYADYTELEKLTAQANKILAEEAENPGTYTQSTITALTNAVNAADAIERNLLATEENQATIDAAADNLKAAIDSMKYKADYSEYDAKMDEAEEIIDGGNQDGTYTDSAYQEYLDKVAEIDGSLDKDLADLDSNNQRIEDATQALEDAKATLEANKKADYTEFDKAVEELENIVNNPDVYTEETIQNAQDALDNAKQNDDLTSDNQDTVDSITDAMKEVIANAEKKPADYTDYNNEKAEADAIINTGNAYGNGDPIYNETAFEQYKQAVESIDSSLPKDLTADNQGTVDDATSSLKDLKATLEETKNADYTDFNAAKEALQEIVNNPDDYTSASVEAAQKALDEANKVPAGLPVGEGNVYQNMIDSATNAMNQVLDAIEKKADYTDFDKVVDELENIVNNPDKYTDETVQAAKDALDAAEDVSKELPESAQEQLNEVTSQLQQVVDAAQKKADYTDYNNAKTEADNLVNDDGNGNPIYNEEAFQQYKDAVAEIDSTLIKDLPESEQSKVDEATQALKDLRTELDATKGYDEIVVDPEKTVDDVVIKDIVDDIVNDLTQNQGYNEDEIIVEYKNYLGEELAGEAFVGTGSTMRVILKSTGELLEYKLFIIKGDVNGDGKIDAEDYNKSIGVAFGGESYPEENQYFFTANDMDDDGYIDVIDSALIRRMYR